jgi:hypothetical protein
LPPLTVALLVVLPSPQAIVAVKSLRGARRLSSVKVATVPENPPSVAVGVTWPAISGASVTDAVSLADAEMRMEQPTRHIVACALTG